MFLILPSEMHIFLIDGELITEVVTDWGKGFPIRILAQYPWPSNWGKGFPTHTYFSRHSLVSLA